MAGIKRMLQSLYWTAVQTNGRKLETRRYSFFSAAETVFALSSGHGKCGVAVIRATGSHARDALLKLTGLDHPPRPRYALFRKLIDPYTGDTIDHGLVLWFPGPHSFTGEDCIELQSHGGPAVVAALLGALQKVPGCRHAEPGDFTKRAFFNGKLGLTEVEGLGDLIHAETEAQRKQALRQMEGDLGRLYNAWTEKLTRLVAHVEAVIDFGEDENIEDGLLTHVCSDVRELLSKVEAHLDDGRRGERLRGGVHAAIIGAPNAGKSSLLNILCQRPAAIVSPTAGTTRDVLESALDISGYPVLLSDTAGIRESVDPIEQEGVRRALKRAESADLKILIADSSLLSLSFVRDSIHTQTTPTELARHLLHPHSLGEAVFNEDDTIVVLNKTDLLSHDLGLQYSGNGLKVCPLSCKTEEGVGGFLGQLKSILEKMCGNPLAGNPSITQARHRQQLSLCTEALKHFLSLTDEAADSGLDLAAEELRTAIRHLGRVTGKVGIEQILDVVFKDFCIGK